MAKKGKGMYERKADAKLPTKAVANATASGQKLKKPTESTGRSGKK